MFNVKCKKCGRKISKNFDFCPFCGYKTRDIEKEYGFLGKEDSVDFPDFGMNLPLGNIFNSLIKEMDKQFKQLDREIQGDNKEIIKKPGISISISTSPGQPPKISVNNLNNKQKEESKLISERLPKKSLDISEKEAKKMSKLPRQEADTKVRRLSNKIVYEISLPGVKDIHKIFVNKLENSIEIKAFSKERVYFKLIPVNLPILDYRLKEEKLFLELSERT
jgi:hypothetical protein